MKKDIQKTTDELVDLMIQSSNHNPYSGRLNDKQNKFAAIDLAELCKNFADDGDIDEAMYVDSEQWGEVITKLKKIS
jgi:hypothetical protein